MLRINYDLTASELFSLGSQCCSDYVSIFSECTYFTSCQITTYMKFVVKLEIS